MDLTKKLHPDLILLHPDVKDRWELLDLLVRTACTHAMGGYGEEVKSGALEAVLKREQERGTGIGKGFAMPHARLRGLSDIVLCLAVLKEGMDFEAPDNVPARVVCLVLTSEENPTVALKVMATLVSFLSDTHAEDFVLHASSPRQVYEHLRRKHLSFGFIVTAKDIMREPLVTIRPSTPLREVTQQMQRHNLEAVAVVEEDGTVAGEITCDSLFQIGIPDFLNQLRSVSFIRNFDPFEKYFEADIQAVARDVMSSRFCVMEEDATLIEIVFALSVQHYIKIHIVRNGKKIGTIDRSAVLDKILNL